MRHLSSWIRYHHIGSTCLLLALLVLMSGSSLVRGRTVTHLSAARSCGDLGLSGLSPERYTLSYGENNVPIDPGKVRQAEQCFVSAYQRCQTATLTVSAASIDTGASTTFTLKKQSGTCQIAESVQSSRFSANFTSLGTCQRLAQSEDSLILVACTAARGGDFVIPRAELCGAVIAGYPENWNQQAEACFIQDYHLCYPAELYYKSLPPPHNAYVEYLFQLSRACKLTVIVKHALPGMPCASMIQQTGGLLFKNCGEQNALFVPVDPWPGAT